MRINMYFVIYNVMYALIEQRFSNINRKLEQEFPNSEALVCLSAIDKKSAKYFLTITVYWSSPKS